MAASRFPAAEIHDPDSSRSEVTRIDVLIERLRAAQERRAVLERRLLGLPGIVLPAVAGDLEQRLREKLADWRGLLTRNVESGRAVLKALLEGPLRFTPILEGRRPAYAFEGSISLEKLVSGVIELPTLTGVASPTRQPTLYLERPRCVESLHGADTCA
jgi:hypothetical protein